MKLRHAFASVSVFLALLGTTPMAHAALVGHYSFEDAAGTVVADASGRGNHGVLVNPRSDTWSAGHSGGGLFLPGIPGFGATYVDLGNPSDFQLTNAFTVAAWVYSTAPDTDAPILAKEDLTYGTSYWFGVFYNGFGTLCDVDGWWDWDFDRRSLPVPSWNRWNHLAATWDGTTLRQYLNGALVDAVPFAGPVATTDSRLMIGVNSGVWSTAFTGMLDDVRIYDDAQTAAQVSELAGAVVSGCVSLQGVPLANAKVQLKQTLAGRQTTETDSAGCYTFGTIGSGEAFKIEIIGPVVP